MKKVTYKLFLEGKDQQLNLEQVRDLAQANRIKSDTRIFNNESKEWIDFKDYKLLHRLVDRSHIEQTTPLAIGSKNQMLIQCSHCNHSYSKRATQCPKCGKAEYRVCCICEAHIQAASKECPECGDPSPFEDQKISTAASGQPVHQVSDNKDIERNGCSLGNTNVSGRKRTQMNPFFRWILIIGAWFLTSGIFAHIKIVLEDKGYQLSAEAAAIFAMVSIGFPLLIAFLIFLWTRKAGYKQSAEVNEYGEEATRASQANLREKVETRNDDGPSKVAVGCIIAFSFIIIGLIILGGLASP